MVMGVGSEWGMESEETSRKWNTNIHSQTFTHNQQKHKEIFLHPSKRKIKLVKFQIHDTYSMSLIWKIKLTSCKMLAKLLMHKWSEIETFKKSS